MKPPPFLYHRPLELEGALEVLSREGDEAKVLAGGQSLVPLLNLRLVRPSHLVDLNRVTGLPGLRQVDGELRIGAMTRTVELETSPLVAASWPLLARGAAEIGHVQIRNRGTVGGSIAHADPAAELPALLLALDGRAVVQSVRGRREIPAGDFFRGLFTTALEPDEVVVELRVPPQRGGSGFAEFARRHGDFALAGAACTGIGIGEQAATVVLFGAAAQPLRFSVPPSAGRDEVRELVRDGLREVDLTGDIHASPEWRRRVLPEMAARALAEAAA